MSCPPTPIAGDYLRPYPQGFAVHFCASSPNLRAVRKLARTDLLAQGLAADVVDSAVLVLSELVGNSVRACGNHVPLVVEVYVTSYGVVVNVHDPNPGIVPRRRETPLDSTDAEGGRGLRLVDLLAPGWHVRQSAIGKQVRSGPMRCLHRFAWPRVAGSTLRRTWRGHAGTRSIRRRGPAMRGRAAPSVGGEPGSLHASRPGEL
ncbi:MULTISPECIES: ATP-binding protein [Streptomyces]|nr:ATP-binding protein [Streptomyces ruber]